MTRHPAVGGMGLFFWSEMTRWTCKETGLGKGFKVCFGLATFVAFHDCELKLHIREDGASESRNLVVLVLVLRR